MAYPESLKSNIWKYYLFEALISLAFFYPIFNLFYLARGLSITQIAFLGVVWTITNMLLEIPSGVIADKWGRKKTLSLFTVLFMSQSVIIIFAHSYILFMVASACHAAAFAFFSGANVAFFYDTLIEIKRKDDYAKLWGRMQLFNMLPSLLAMLLGGVLYSINQVLPYLATAIFLLIAFIVTLTFREPKFHKSSKQVSILTHLKESVSVIFSKRSFITIVMTGAIIGFSIDFIFSYGQIYLKEINLASAFFGIVYAAISLISSLGYVFAERIQNRFRFQNTIYVFLIISSASIIILSRVKALWAISLLVIPFFFRACYRLLQRGYLHKQISSHNRATVDSVANFSIALIAVIAEPILGRIADVYSIFTSFLIVGILVLAYLVVFSISSINPRNRLS